ncbi:sugar ABC transporter permease [Cohnella faecalis]|uniref:sugar ABC transporter permease n=1 Tax=Cohnella faecalis TaxID=2315694 RepID=UPI00360D06BC
MVTNMNTEINSTPRENAQPKTKLFKLDVRAYTMIVSLVGIWLLFSFLNETFLTPRNLSNLFVQMSVTSVLAIGMVLVIVAGQIDLSVGSIVGLTGAIAAILNVWLEWDTTPVIIVTILVGVVIGFFQGWLVAYKAIPAFIVTLGGMLVFRGILLGLTGGATISSLSPGIKFLGKGYVEPFISIIAGLLAIAATVFFMIRKRINRAKYGFELTKNIVFALQMLGMAILIVGFVFAMNQYRGVPIPFVIVIFLALLFAFIARKTIFGRQVFAVGGNAEAARLSGINIKKRILSVFILCNTLAAIAGLILTARLDAATTSAGTMYELDAIAACVIGGTSLIGGVGTIPGALLGALIMASLDNGMSIINLDSYWQSIVKGSILVLAVWVDIYSRKKQASK